MTEGDIMPGPELIDFYLPEYKTLTRLYCLNGGHHLRIQPDGTVDGEREETDVYTVLRMTAVSVGVVVVEGVEAGRYLAMDKDGQLYGSKTVNDECHFHEKIEENHYNTYKSQRYGDLNWYLGIKNSGRPKKGPRTGIGQKHIYFLPRQVDGAGKTHTN
ncbi:hypothetical protein SKAU_G00266680 [Synaphobranchus kaupii]|uniref:Fibroblast growth factor n=1 Tax=Synaphobranchus kaupii TaxID=118154 RepID=A0A9Q1EZR8_SYNKA|nr:hypothetical protein SKAU_G00266680 [Synaphobranchus kaupii]